MSDPPDEFAWIASLRPLTGGDPAAWTSSTTPPILPSRPGFDLVISKDAMVEGVHFLAGEAPDVIARRLIRVSLSDLAAKAAAPVRLFPDDRLAQGSGMGLSRRLRGRPGEGRRGVRDSPSGRRHRIHARAPDAKRHRVGLGSARPGGHAVGRPGGGPVDGMRRHRRRVAGPQGRPGEIADPAGRLANRYRLPAPLLCLRDALRAHAHAAADVSDGLLADAGHIGEASGLGLSIDLDRFNLSPEARAWCAAQPGGSAARLALATGGDDYAIVCAIDPADAAAFLDAPSARRGSFRPRHRRL